MLKSAGQIAYEKDLQEAPCYPQGNPRPTWQQLSEQSRYSWERLQVLRAQDKLKATNNA